MHTQREISVRINITEYLAWIFKMNMIWIVTSKMCFPHHNWKYKCLPGINVIKSIISMEHKICLAKTMELYVLRMNTIQISTDSHPHTHSFPCTLKCGTWIIFCSSSFISATGTCTQNLCNVSWSHMCIHLLFQSNKFLCKRAHNFVYGKVHLYLLWCLMFILQKIQKLSTIVPSVQITNSENEISFPFLSALSFFMNTISA